MSASETCGSPNPEPWIARVTAILDKPVVRVAVSVLVTLIALTVLYDLAGLVRWSDVKADMAQTPWRGVALAVFWAAFSFVFLSLHDVFAVQSVAQGKRPLRVAGLAGAYGYAVSNCLGFPKSPERRSVTGSTPRWALTRGGSQR